MAASEQLPPAGISKVVSNMNGGDLRAQLSRYSDIALAALVVGIVGMMIIPLPTFLLDLLISLNIAVSVTLLLIAIYVSDALKIATFPSLLLITTLFRLALEVSATRLILLKADGGEVIHAFGNFVVAGNLVVGGVIFFILTIIQFVVISKGAERVAEVGARFTLDAMPGKQMSIDAELRGGHIDHHEARRRRALLTRESQFFGAMDGAMKFVKGDAIAGVVVLVTNIVGGLIIGMVQRGLDAGAAARTYTVLTIGEGLVAQIPALIISTAAGIIVTRVSSEEEGGHLGRDIGLQILGQPKALGIAGALLLAMALVPGLPTVPFLLLGLVLCFVAYQLPTLGRDPSSATSDDTSQGGAAARGPATRDGAAGRSEALPLLAPIAIELAGPLADEVLAGAGGARLLREVIPALRERYFAETGIVLPAVRLRPIVGALNDGGFVIRLNEVPMARGEVVPGGGLTFETPARLAAANVPSRTTVYPDGTAAAWIAREDLAAARVNGIAVLGTEEFIAAHLLQLVRRYGHEFVGVQEAQALLDGIEKTQPALVREVVPKLVSPILLADVLRRLAEERVSLRDLREILGALAQWAPHERDPVALTEHVRAALRRQITHQYAGAAGTLGVFMLDPVIEDTVREAIHKTASGSYLALEPGLARDIVMAVRRAIPASNSMPVLVTNADIRRYVKRLVEGELPGLAVLSFQELSPETQLQPLGRVSVAEA